MKHALTPDFPRKKAPSLCIISSSLPEQKVGKREKGGKK
jgi:hypothetical protein